MFRKLALVLLVLAAIFPFAPSATAGGWAAVVLETPLEEVVVSEETTVAYRVLAHGRAEAPVTGMHVDFLFLHEETGFFVAVSGEATSDPEVYSITFHLLEEGEWGMRSMIRNYGGRPLLQKHPVLVASSWIERADS